MHRSCATRERGELGMTTAEYGVGIVCSAAIGCGLIQLVDSGWFADFFQHVFVAAFTKTLPDLFGPLW